MALRPSSVVRRLAAFATAFLPLLSSAAPVDRAEVRRISLLPEAEQRRPANQAVLQQWFFPRVTEFQEVLSGTSVGSLVRLGDLAAWKRRFVPPGGAGDWLIVWEVRSKGPTKERGEPFYFPSNAFDTYFSGEESLTTNWHEVQHGLLADFSLSAPRFWAADQEHYYVEDHVQNVVLWLQWLTKKDRFEQFVREAGAKADELRDRGVAIDLAAERSLWANARAAWLARFGPARLVRTPPPPLRAEYERITGVKAPSVEEVIAFYMRGGVRKEKGAPIPVPEWVLTSDEIRGSVAIEHDRAQDVIEARPEVARYRFALRVVDPRMPPGAPMRVVRPVTRGVLVLKLESDDDAARIDVSAGGKPVAGMPVANGTSGRRAEVDFRKLAGGLRPGGFLDVTFTRPSPRTLRAKSSYRVVAEYLDSGTPADPAVYHPSRAVVFVDVTPPQAAGAAGAPAAGGGASGAVSGGGYFRLAKETREGAPCTSKPNAKGEGAAMSATLEGTRYRTSFHAEYASQNRRFDHSLDASWTAPPAALRPGDVLTVALTGEVKRVPTNDLAFDGIRSSIGIGIPPSPFHAPIACSPCLTGPGVRAPLERQDNGGFSPSASTRIVAPKGGRPENAAPLLVELRAGGPRNDCEGFHVVYRYEWVPGGGAGPTETRVEARSEMPPEPPTPPQLDEEPPKEGEVVPVVPPNAPPGKGPATGPARKTPPAAPPAAAERWYEHPQKGYRFPLPKGYELRSKTRLGEADAGFDTVFAPEESAALVCARGSEDVSRKDPAELLAAWTADVSRGDRSAVTRRQIVGGAPGTVVETFEDGVATHHVAFVSDGRAYHLSAAFPSPKAAPLPRELRVLLDGLRAGAAKR